MLHHAPNHKDRPGERLQKVLAAAGIGSRRHCEEYILAGRVTVDGEVAQELGVRVDPQRQEIRLDGEPVRAERKRYFMFNKPPGALCTNADPAGRERVIDFFKEKEGRLFTVGRLDENSQGLLIVTNDGELANRLAHPRYRILRTYRVQVAGRPTRETLAQLREGLYFQEGKFWVEGVRGLSSRGNSTFLEIELRQGRNREIRRLLARVGHKVMHLERIAFGPLKLSRVPPGRYRELTPDELKQLRALAEGRTNHGREPGARRERSKGAKTGRGGAPPRGGRPSSKRTAAARRK